MAGLDPAIYYRAKEVGAARKDRQPTVSDDNRMADAHKSAGVDIAEADAGLRNIVRPITATWPQFGHRV